MAQSALTGDSLRAMIAMLDDFRDMPLFDTLRVDSLQHLPRQLQPKRWASASSMAGAATAPPPLRMGGMTVVVDRSLPAWMGVMLNPHGRPKMMIVDLRKRPRTDDMAQMLDDLRQSGGARA